jgi:hypothetical protein
MACRKKYILAFDGAKETERTREHLKLYLGFKKDLAYE